MGTSGSKVDNCFLCVFGDKADVNQPEQHLRTDPAVAIDSSGSSSGHDGSGMGSNDTIHDVADFQGVRYLPEGNVGLGMGRAVFK